jgi:hypothetical protein
MKRDRDIHRLNLRIVEDMSRGVLVDLLQVSGGVLCKTCRCMRTLPFVLCAMPCRIVHVGL